MNSRSKLSISSEGFTLVELLLAMTLFSLTMVIATGAFIAMNRIYTRGVIRQQIAESAQFASDQIEKTVRSDGREKFTICKDAASQPSECPLRNSAQWKGILCFAGSRYIWNVAGMYKQTGSAGLCNSTTDGFKDNGIVVVDERFLIEDITLTPIPEQKNLISISGVIRTKDPNAFDNLGNTDKNTIVCKGTTVNSAVQTCAIAKFSYIINARGMGI